MVYIVCGVGMFAGSVFVCLFGSHIPYKSTRSLTVFYRCGRIGADLRPELRFECYRREKIWPGYRLQKDISSVISAGK